MEDTALAEKSSAIGIIARESMTKKTYNKLKKFNGELEKRVRDLSKEKFLDWKSDEFGGVHCLDGDSCTHLQMTQRSLEEVAVDLQNARFIEELEIALNKVTIGKIVEIRQVIGSKSIDEKIAILGYWDWWILGDINNIPIFPVDCLVARGILGKRVGETVQLKSRTGEKMSVEILSMFPIF